MIHWRELSFEREPNMRILFGLTAFTLLALAKTAGVAAEALPIVSNVELQPLKAQVRRVVDALTFLGEPSSAEQQAKFDAAVQEQDADKAIGQIQEVLDQRALAGVNINPEQRVKVARGPAAAVLN